MDRLRTRNLSLTEITRLKDAIIKKKKLLKSLKKQELEIEQKIRNVRSRNENALYYSRDSAKTKPILAQLKALDKKLDQNWDKQDKVKNEIHWIRRIAPLKINFRRKDPFVTSMNPQKRQGYGLTEMGF